MSSKDRLDPKDEQQSALVRVPEAARLVGIPRSTLREAFIREDKQPKNIPPPPPHRRIGRSVYIIVDQLPAWASKLNEETLLGPRKRGRPTVSQRIARRSFGNS